MLQLLEHLKAEGKTIFLSSHILPEVEQIADHVVILNRGRMMRSGRLQDLLAGEGRVEIVVDRVPPELAQTTLRDVPAAPGAQGMSLMVETARKREVVEALWAAGCDVIAMTPMRSTLEEAFLKEIDPAGGAR